MTEREGPPPTTVDDLPRPSVPDQRKPPPEPPERLSPLAIASVTGVSGLALGWFLTSWIVLKSPITDAIGETVGSLAGVLLIVSIIGVARHR